MTLLINRLSIGEDLSRYPVIHVPKPSHVICPTAHTVKITPASQHATTSPHLNIINMPPRQRCRTGRRRWNHEVHCSIRRTSSHAPTASSASPSMPSKLLQESDPSFAKSWQCCSDMGGWQLLDRQVKVERASNSASSSVPFLPHPPLRFYLHRLPI